jgi:hypothetical protein
MIGEFPSAGQAMVGVEPVVEENPCRFGNPFVPTLLPRRDLLADGRDTWRRGNPRFQQVQLVTVRIPFLRHVQPKPKPLWFFLTQITLCKVRELYKTP